MRTIFALVTTGIVTAGFLVAELMTAMGGGAGPDKGVKGDLKDAADATGRAAKKTGNKVKRGSKKAVNKTAEGTEGAAKKVKEKTR